jgi:hypothetical protein
MRFLFPILAVGSCFWLFGCSAARGPSSRTPVAAVTATSAPPTEPEPEASTEQEAPSEREVDKGPELDCTKFRKGKAPNRRWLCDLVMKDRPSASVLDARGFAAVEYYDQTETEDTDVPSKERLCSAKAEERFAKIARYLPTSSR